MWQRLEELVGEGQYFRMQAGKPSYLLDESIDFTLEIPESGYLNLLSVDAEDTATVLFPNEWDDDNFVTAGSFTFPTTANAFDLAAARPLGPTLVVAFVSEVPVNFRDFGIDGRLPSGELDPDAIFTNVTYAATRAIKVRRRPDAAAAASAGNSAPATDDEDPEGGQLAAVAATAAGAVAAASTAAAAGAAEVADADIAVSIGGNETAAAPTETSEDAATEAAEDEAPWLYASSLEISVAEPAE